MADKFLKRNGDGLVTDCWNYATFGKTTVFFDLSDRCVSEMHIRGRVIARNDAADYLDAHPAISKKAKAALDERIEADDEWRHETPHHRYGCDRGCLAVRVNQTSTLLIRNGYGDGNHPVYVVGSDDEVPTSFRQTGAIIEGPALLDVLNYDCNLDDANTLTTILLERGEEASFRADSGAVVISVRR